jgi:hypothetical protein
MSGQSQLFKSFGKDKVSGHSQLKASVQRAIRGMSLPASLAGLIAQGAPACWLRYQDGSLGCVAAARIAEDYPWLVETGVLEVILPKKQDLVLVKL